MNQKGQSVWNARQAANEVTARHQLILKDHTVRHILSRNLGMKYKKIKRIAFQGNSNRCLFLR